MTLNKPSPRLAILSAQLAAKAEAEQLQRDTMRLWARAPIRCKAPAPDAATLPLPPDYWSELELWLKTLAPAKPAAQQPEPTIKVGDTVMTKYDGLATVISLGSGELLGEVATVRILSNGYEGCTSVAGLKRISQPESAARLASTSSADGAAPLGAKLTHAVCCGNKMESYSKIGDVIPWAHCYAPGVDWRMCHKDGWIPHTPTADSKCPVPDGVEIELMTQQSPTYRHVARVAPGMMREVKWRGKSTIVAWRPIADVVK